MDQQRTMPPRFPPSYGPNNKAQPPGPGQKIYVGNFPLGSWELSFVQGGNTYTVGESKAVADGSHLIYDDPPNGLFPYLKRDLAGSEDQDPEDGDPQEPALNATIRLNNFQLPATTPKQQPQPPRRPLRDQLPRPAGLYRHTELSAPTATPNPTAAAATPSKSRPPTPPATQQPTRSMRLKRVFSQPDECDYEWAGFEAYGLTTPEDGGAPCYLDGAW
ncbi:uncharacterized protein NFIA_103250 [Aspergillus fischeri NRRL 181]|uniref:Uncharacterized protein n=1 Tax=Neosartorya fischeri (strain ATCC 1020 / DSM 3700 / CBS 544.65 / FGSC A1164 / JCM 1740 / NRRL 181 / WB 181) TaxID=331117 RepID=A1CW35_NEOFI|nr:uncharacterized protein NFIA_103250 [Aspergillus fischeri NRRL 181]EAW24837.1 hypothetical protein NFIA_103250 [Aspergillus fischeri NRRL 181]